MHWQCDIFASVAIIIVVINLLHIHSTQCCFASFGFEWLKIWMNELLYFKLFLNMPFAINTIIIRRECIRKKKQEQLFENIILNEVVIYTLSTLVDLLTVQIGLALILRQLNRCHESFFHMNYILFFFNSCMCSHLNWMEYFKAFTVNCEG